MQIQEVNSAALKDVNNATEAVDIAIQKDTVRQDATVEASETPQAKNQRAIKAYKNANHVESMQMSGNGDTAAFSQSGLSMSHAGARVRTVTNAQGEVRELPKLNKLNVPIPE